MLQYKSILPETLGLLKELFKFPQLEHFSLVGGTAISLQIGHRISEDLDFFTSQNINTGTIKQLLNTNFQIVKTISDVNTLNCFINFKNKIIKVEFISYKYDLLKPVKNIDNMRLLELDDLIPMKLSAIANRGAKKDFYDIYFLLKKYSLSEMLRLFKQKYKTENLFHLIKNLTFFEDAENDPNPVLLTKIDWNTIKKSIIMEVKKNI